MNQRGMYKSRIGLPLYVFYKYWFLLYFILKVQKPEQPSASAMPDGEQVTRYQETKYSMEEVELWDVKIFRYVCN